MGVMKKISAALGMRGGLCDRFDAASSELTHEAKVLKAYLDLYQNAPDPLGAMLGSMWNNHQWQKFKDRVVDDGNGSGVRNRRIDTAHRVTR